MAHTFSSRQVQAGQHEHHTRRPRRLAHPLHHIIVLLALLALLLPLSTVPVSAQNQAPITLEVRAGFDGAYRIDEWFPVDVVVANNGPDVRGTLEWSYPGPGGDKLFSYVIDLPRGSNKRVTLDVFSEGAARNGRMRLMNGSTMLAEQIVPLEIVDTNQLLVGVISSDATLLSGLTTLRAAGFNGAQVRHFDASLLPDRAVALRGVNVLFLHHADTTQLTPEQLSALSLWTRMGGQLVVSGGIDSAQMNAGIHDLLPVEVTGDLFQGSVEALASIPPRANAEGLNETVLNVVQPKAGAQALPDTTNALLFEWQQGGGNVVFTTFDLAALRGWAGEAAFWQRVLNPGEFFTPAITSRQQRVNLLYEALLLPGLSLPPVALILALLVLYLLAVGPVTYLVLRRMRRLEWAWITLPVTMLAFSTVFYVVGFGLRGGQSQVHQVAVVQAFEGDQRGIATAYIGLFSPRRSSYTLDFNAHALLSEARTWSDPSDASTPVLASDTSVQVPEVLVDVASIRTFIAESTVEVPLAVESSLRREGRTIRGEIRNTGSIPLEDVIIVRGTNFQLLGTLPSGASGSVDLDSSIGNFPWGVGLMQTENFDRQRFLAELVNRNTRNLTASNTIYLMAWGNAPVISLGINGQPANQQGIALYIIQLEG